MLSRVVEPKPFGSAQMGHGAARVENQEDVVRCPLSLNARRIFKVVAMQRTLFAHSHYTNRLPAAAWVVGEPATNGVDVKIELEMTDPYSTGSRTIDLGHSASLEEAIRNWGFMNWGEDGLHVGRGSNEFFVARKELESGGR